MKISIVPVFAAAALLLSGPLPAQQAEVSQALISTGRIVNVMPNGVVVLRTDETNHLLTFQGMTSAPLFFVRGERAAFTDLQPDRHATIYYSRAGNRLVVGKVLIAEPLAVAPPPAALTHAEQRALRSKAANDGDITTQPANKARIDGDPTTEPGKKDPLDPDITKQPAR